MGSLTNRNALAPQIIALLNGAEFNDQALSDAQAKALLSYAKSLLAQALTLAQ
jgi:hypothetical protein